MSVDNIVNLDSLSSVEDLMYLILIDICVSIHLFLKQPWVVLNFLHTHIISLNIFLGAGVGITTFLFT